MIMEAVKKNVPALRFTGFEGDWVQASFGSFVKRTSNKYDPNSDSEVYPCIELEHLSSETGILLGTVRSKDQKSIKNYFNEGEVLYGKLRPYLKKYYFAKFDGVCSSEIWVLKGVGVSNVFLYYLIQTSKFNDDVNVTSGSKMPRAEWDVISSSLYNYPSILEQTKIASFLTAVDDKINQLTRKKELLEQYKKGVMQKIFSREIKFRDEQGKEFPEWKSVRGKNLFESHSNKEHNGDLPILAATQDKGMVYRDSIGIEIISSEESIRSYKIVERGDFVISLRSFQGGIEYSYVKGICSPAYVILKPKVALNEHFYRHYFKKEDFITRLSKTVVGIRDGKQISYEAFSSLKLPFPIIEEQQKIASFLASIDGKISLVSVQIEKMQTWKKGLLQKMFV